MESTRESQILAESKQNQKPCDVMVVGGMFWKTQGQRSENRSLTLSGWEGCKYQQRRDRHATLGEGGWGKLRMRSLGNEQEVTGPRCQVLERSALQSPKPTIWCEILQSWSGYEVFPTPSWDIFRVTRAFHGLNRLLSLMENIGGCHSRIMLR